MSEPVRPALTPGEWRHGFPDVSFGPDTENEYSIRAWDGLEGMVRVVCENCITHLHGGVARRHALAALCLYGQPFGFSQDDVEALRELAEACRCEALESEAFGAKYEAETKRLWQIDAATNARRATSLLNLAARIAALLPPSDSEG